MANNMENVTVYKQLIGREILEYCSIGRRIVFCVRRNNCNMESRTGLL